MLTKLIDDIAGILPKDRIHDHPALVSSYAVDASFFEPRAKLVVDVQTLEELSGVLAACTRHELGVTFRGSGTAVSGQACGEGVIVRFFGPEWTCIDVLDSGASFWAGSGVIGAAVNTALAPHKRKMAADPASITSATMGGIVADNSAGMCCMVEQNCYHMVRGMRLMLADGTYLDTSDKRSVSAFRQSHAVLLDELVRLREKIRAETAVVERIRRKYTLKNTIGYTVNSFVDHDDPVDILIHLMVGSEGTLAFIHETLMETIPTPPVRATGLMFFPALKDATDAVMAMKGACRIEAAEIFDWVSVKAMQKLTGIPEAMKNLPENSCAMLIETKAWNGEELKENMDSILEILNRFPRLSEHVFSTDERQCVQYWDVRRGLFPAIANYREADEYVLTEDINVEVKDLAEVCDALQEMFTRHGFDAGIMGHAFHGNLHFSLPVKIADPESVQRLDHFMLDLVDLITKRFDGSLKAEHGTGRAMAPFVRNEWGDFLFEIMCEIKRLFDPKGILNPGVLINESNSGHLDGLKNPMATHPKVDMCVECGFCQLVCPSKDIGLNPRQRISLARAIAKLRAQGKTAEADEWQAVFDRYGEQLCATDGLCSLSCPLGADVATMIRDIRHEKSSSGKKRAADFVTRHYGGVLKAASFMLDGVSIAHRAIGDAAMDRMSRAARSVSGNRIPLWNPAMPKGGAQSPQPVAPAGKERIVYFPSCAVRSMGPAKGDPSDPLMDVTVRLLERAGYGVVFPAEMGKLCCGKAMETKGLYAQADALARELNQALLEASDNGKHLVLCDTSPCLARMKKTLSSRLTLMDPIEFVMTQAVDRLTLHKLPRTVALHPTCSTRSMGLAGQMAELASKCAERVVVPTGINCCGFSGDKGFHRPELNASALADLRDQIADCDEGYSVSRTCEIGLTLHGGKNYRNILYLVEEASR